MSLKLLGIEKPRALVEKHLLARVQKLAGIFVLIHLQEGLDPGKERFDISIREIVVDLFRRRCRVSRWLFTDCAIPQVLQRWSTSGLRTSGTGEDYKVLHLQGREQYVLQFVLGLPGLLLLGLVGCVLSHQFTPVNRAWCPKSGSYYLLFRCGHFFGAPVSWPQTRASVAWIWHRYLVRRAVLPFAK